MEISNALLHQYPMEEMLMGNSPKTTDQQQEKARVRPQPDKSLKCPRCDSTNTKFCYYNNYSLSQPRYFCKGCRRYWTQGGSLRNVPVGGGCRKNKRSSSSSSKKPLDQTLINSNSLLSTLPPPPPLSYDPSDLTLAFSMLHKHDNFFLVNPNPNPNPNPSHNSTGFLDILSSGFFETSNQSGFHNPSYGLGGNGSVEKVVFPIEGGFGGATTETREGFCKDMVGGDGNNMDVETTRDYWNGVGSYWHSIINSSMM